MTKTPESPITGEVTVPVIDRLEVVDIAEHQMHLILFHEMDVHPLKKYRDCTGREESL